MESIFGGLIEFENEQEMDNFLLTINKDKALQIIEKQIQYLIMNGGFTLVENYVLYKCLLKLKQNENE